MRKFSLMTLIGVLFLSLNLSASGDDLFSYDKEALSNELQELQQLEDYVTSNQNSTLTDLVAGQNALVMSLDMMAANPTGTGLAFGEPPLGIPSFLWGCVLGIPGIAIVYFVSEDSEETKKALWGCVASSVVGVVLYVVWIGALFSTTAAI